MIDGQAQNDFSPDVTEINDYKLAPLTREELRNRLKHIAMLCWGLSIDITNDKLLSENLKAENEQLRAQVTLLGGRLPSGVVGVRRTQSGENEIFSEKELKKLERRRTYNREYQRKLRQKQKQKKMTVSHSSDSGGSNAEAAEE